MKHCKVTLEAKKEAVRIAIAGGDPLHYLDGLGAGNPAQMWYAIKSTLKDKDPETYAKLPKRIVRKDGMPNKTTVTAAEYMENAKNAADEFFGKCEEMGLKVNGEQVKKPNLIVSGPIMVSAIRHKNFGEFYRDFDHNCIDWRTREGDEVSLSTQGWKSLVAELPELLKLLGVEV